MRVRVEKQDMWSSQSSLHLFTPSPLPLSIHRMERKLRSREIPPSPAAADGGDDKRRRGASQPSCQADRCDADLTDAKRYYRRHRVCEAHSKAPVVIVAGLRQRFCQQCSRFHELAEFDDAKRSCRRRLAAHNERRRKTAADQISSN